MQNFRVHILGCGSALPTMRHGSSSQIVEIRNKFFMIDCGEGTQMQLRKVHVHFNKIDAVFISHTHGDHCFGLLGLISTIGMLGRTAPLHVYAPADYELLFNAQIEYFCQGLEYEVVFHPVDTTRSEIIYDDRSLTIETIPLQHRVACCGFLFREKPGKRHINREMIDFYNVPLSQLENIRLGADWTDAEGNTIANERLTTPADPVRSYAYCSDTRYIPDLYKLVKDVNLLYHEATYANDYADRARLYNHSTAGEAAKVARDACAGQLLLGHFSRRYKDERVLLDEAKAIFPNTLLADEGKVFECFDCTHKDF